jgi:hypothetical protein
MSLTKASYSMINGAVLNVLDYGADSTGATDSTSAIQTALNAAAALNGCILFFPRGTYTCANTLSLPSIVVGLSLVGEGADNTNLGGSRIVYTGASANDFFKMDVLNTRWCNIRMLDIRGTNASATGNLISVSIFNGNIEDCHFSMVSVANDVVNINESIDFKITRCYVRGGIANVAGNINNAVIFDQCDFGGQTNYAVGLNIPSGVTFTGCTFEPDATGAKANGIYVEDGNGVTVQGCWLGDVITVSGSPVSNWIEFAGKGLVVTGNQIGGDGFHKITVVKIHNPSNGICFTGNAVIDVPTVVNIDTGITEEVYVVGNSLLDVDAIVTGTIASGGNLFTQEYEFGTSNMYLTTTSLRVTKNFITEATTVAALPVPVSLADSGKRAFVTDANSVTFNAAAVGGGSFRMPVFCNGTAWFIG